MVIMGVDKPIYLDNNATTPCDPRVVEKMLPFFSEIYGNPSNGYHIQGRMAAKAVENAREQIADLIGAQPYEILFTSGATESNNLAIFGVAHLPSNKNHRKIITSPIEHKAVLNPCKQLASEGFDVGFLPVNSQGEVDVQIIEKILDSSPFLVAVHLANNEIGTIQPIKAIAECAHGVGALVHCDAAQAVGKISVDVDELGVDMLSMSAHKFYGPKGIGALYIRGGLRAIQLVPLLLGGGQEKGLRSGTSNVSGIVGFGEAARLCLEGLNEEMLRVQKLRAVFENGLISKIPGLIINGHDAVRLPNTSSFIIPKVEADAMLLNLPNIMLGTGSACTSGAVEPSHVLQAIGVSRDAANRTIRASLGRFTTYEQISQAVQEIVAAYRSIS